MTQASTPRTGEAGGDARNGSAPADGDGPGADGGRPAGTFDEVKPFVFCSESGLAKSEKYLNVTRRKRFYGIVVIMQRFYLIVVIMQYLRDIVVMKPP